MTRRSLFATIAAIFAGRKIPPLQAPALVPMTATAVRVYTPVRYGLGFSVPRNLWDDDATHQAIYAMMCSEQKLREEELAAEMFRGGVGIG